MKSKVHRRLVLVLVLSVVGFLKWNSLQSHEELESDRLALCPAVSDVASRPFAEEDFSGEEKKVQASGFDDVYLYDREGKIKAGLRAQWGASLIYFGESEETDSTNVIDNASLDRGVHLKFEAHGFSARQAGNTCGVGSPIDAWTSAPLSATISTLMSACPTDSPKGAKLRVNETLRFVKRGILEIEYAMTNLGSEAVLSNESRFPSLHVRNNLKVLRNARGKILSREKREPTNLEDSPEGWASFADESDKSGVGILWENRNSHPLPGEDPEEGNSLRSNFGFTLPAQDTAVTRVYLLLGGFRSVRTQALALDHSIPPFGRIDLNHIEENTRTVTLRGWALDNKEVEALELWIDGNKISDLKLNSLRPEVCAAHPGYPMCEKTHGRIGFESTYMRPEGSGCPRPVEVRARDNDGNWRVIARQSVKPVLNARNEGTK